MVWRQCKGYRYPFDRQYCDIRIESWLYASNQLILEPYPDDPTTGLPDWDFERLEEVSALVTESARAHTEEVT